MTYISVLLVFQACIYDKSTEPNAGNITVQVINPTSYELQGQIFDDGAAQVTECGICWSNKKNPTIHNSKMKGEIQATFSLKLTGFEIGSLNYFRTYAINRHGISYGEEKALATTAVDVEGNEYNSVEIEGVRWMTDNLKTTKFNDGTPITNLWDATKDLHAPYYTWWNGQDDFKNKYGAFYTIEVIKSGKICPKGWRIPTIPEAEALKKFGDKFIGNYNGKNQLFVSNADDKAKLTKTYDYQDFALVGSGYLYMENLGYRDFRLSNYSGQIWVYRDTSAGILLMESNRIEIYQNQDSREGLFLPCRCVKE
ncbi:MAG: fibrobacter succinogenes major paralogous domain-containing protein [Flavobacteriales bacterium]|nr:fibrobacter succinogenes major paralogous domain-containing protein [Flavobacteriales bacterium]